ncbi:MAG TPA: C40 family peptidase [Acidimicrobiales bacterium]|nr:C40 family peptidase [Acidimicrobiales bacterium]
MGLGRRLRPPGGATVWLSAVILAVVTTACAERPSAPPTGAADRPVDTTTSRPAPTPVVDETLAPGRPALVTVAVATVWNAPGVARPVDQPSLTDPVDVRRWVATMSHDDKLWLVDSLVTQALYGERVVVREIAGAWARVVVTGQPSSQDPDGYPGWMPSGQLRTGEAPVTATSAVVTRATAPLRDAVEPSRPVLDLSYNTRLPVLATGAADVTVALPTGGRGVLAASDVDVVAPGPRPTAGADLVAGARLFSGLPYLWAGTSSAGYDCSGFTLAVYGVRGIVLPRDADDQAGMGTPVDRSRLQPGDLLFYSSTAERSSITHVSMYVGDGMMIQAPATGRTVETVPVDSPAYAPRFWGARRYLPAGAP